ncbi:ATP-binding protein [Natrialbaceae archaeon A-CW1-1]
MKTAHRFLVAFLVVFLVTSAVLVATFDAHRNDVTDYTDGSIEAQADQSADVLDDRLRGQVETLEVAATNDALIDHESDEQASAIEALVETSAFDGASVVDSSGTVRAITTGDDGAASDDLIGADFSDREYVQCALANRSCISDPFMAETDNHIVVISVPVRDDGEIVGTVNAAYHLTETTFFDPLVGSAERTGMTVTADESVLYSDRERFEETIDRQADLEMVDWTVTVHHDQAALGETLDRLRTFQIATGVLLLGTVGGFGLWVYHSQIQRIQRLSRRVGALECRAYDETEPVGGPAEWRRIDRALDRLARSLERREQMLLVYNRILRHNLRNELNIITGYAAHLEATLEDEESTAATDIRLAATDLLDLADRARTTEHLLDRPSSNPPEIDLVDVVTDRVEAFTEAHPGVTVDLETPANAVVVGGEELELVVDELLENVVEHAGDDATIEITVTVTDATVSMQFADDGPGIPEETAALLTGDSDISPLNHSAGIGLWLVDWTVSRYDGALTFPAGAEGGVVEVVFKRGGGDPGD